jgi:hypothetical protein
MARKTRLSLESLETRQLMAFDAFLHLDGVDGESTSQTTEVGDPFVPTRDIDSGEGADPTALLLPAVQKVREAAARMNEEGGLPFSNDSGEQGILIGLLLPAVQKVREAAGGMHEEADLPMADSHDDGALLPAIQKVRDAAQRAGAEASDLPLDDSPGEDDALIGLLLPAVQKVREAAARGDEGTTIDDLIATAPTGEVLPTDQFSLNFEEIKPTVEVDLQLDFVDDDAAAYLKYKLKDCIVTSYQL